MAWFQNTPISMPFSYLSAINPFASLNAFRLTGDYRYNESRLEQMSPKHKEVLINSYNGTLGIPKPDAFENLVREYLKNQNETLSEQLKKSALTDEQKAKYNQLDGLRTALIYELINFTDKIKKLPANTHADALTMEANEEKKIILDKLQLLNKQTEAFTSGLTTPNTTSTANTANTTTPGTSTGTGPDTGTTTGAGGTGVGGVGVGAGTGTDTTTSTRSVATETKTQTDAGAGTTPPKKALTPEEIAAMGDFVDAQNKAFNEAPSTPELGELEKQLTGTINDMHRAAQLERDRIAIFATLTANKRKQSLLTRTFENLSQEGITGLFGAQKAKPPSVLYTGAEQPGIEKLRKAMRLMDPPRQVQDDLKEAQENLEKTETRLKKANDDNDQDKIDQYKKEKENYEATIKKLRQKITPDTTKALLELNGQAGFFLGLTGYNPGLTALSGKKITVTADGQGLGFSMDFPRPIFDPGYYTSSQHNTKGDLLSMAELVKATGAKSITGTITCDNPKMARRLAQEAYEAALEVGFDEEKITIYMNGQKMTAETLFQDLDPQSKQDTGKYTAKKQRAKALGDIANQGRDAVKKTHKPEIDKQQGALKSALKSGRDELDNAFKNDSNAPATPSSPTTIVNP